MSAAPLISDYQLAERVALALLPVPGLAAVLLGGVGDDWQRAPVYPYAVVAPESAEQPRGGVTRTIRVRLVVRAADAASKPDPQTVAGAAATDATLLRVGAGPELDALVQAARDALSAAPLGAPLESIATEYDEDAQFPVQSATLSISLADAQAFGDAF